MSAFLVLAAVILATPAAAAMHWQQQAEIEGYTCTSRHVSPLDMKPPGKCKKRFLDQCPPWKTSCPPGTEFVVDG